MQWQRGRGRPQKPTGPRVEERLSGVGLSVGTCRSAAFPGRETQVDGLDHSLEVSRERVVVVEQRGVDTLLKCAEGVVDAMTQPSVGARCVPPPGDSTELVLEELEGWGGPVVDPCAP